jgi:hypothetical protein
MRSLIWATALALVLATGAASANPLDDAKAGMKAFDKGDNQGAVKLFSSAINSHRLQRSDQELALVKRAEARIALGQGQAALADAYSALNLDPADNEAIATRDRAQAMLNPPPASTATATPAEPSSYLKSQNAYQEALKRYEAQKEADAKHYDEQLARYNAEVKTQTAAHDAQAAAQGKPTPPTSEPSAKPAAITAAAAPPKPVVQATVQPASKPAVKPAQKKPTTPPQEEVPRIL